MGMALESALKKDVEKASRDLDGLTRLYNVYFGGGEEEPPKMQRQQVDQAMTKIRAQLPSASNSADRFQANALLSKHQVLTAKWDKSLRAIEAGTLVLPKMRR